MKSIIGTEKDKIVKLKAFCEEQMLQHVLKMQ
jgi:hypothetical protein